MSEIKVRPPIENVFFGRVSGDATTMERKKEEIQMATAAAVMESNVKIGPTKLLINGRWVGSASGKTFPTINPSTGEVITQVAEADAADVDKAVAAARAAFEKGAWRKRAGSAPGGLNNT